MNSNYDDFLKEVLNTIPEATKDCDFSYITELSKNKSWESIIKNEDFIVDVYDIVNEKLFFLKKYRYAYNSQFAKEHIELAARILKTVMNKLKNLTSSNAANMLSEMITLFSIINIIENNTNISIWQYIKNNIVLNPAYKKISLRIIESVQLSLTTCGNSFIYEKELVNDYRVGIKEKNFEKIYELIDALERGRQDICMGFTIAEIGSIKLLFWFDMDGLIEVIDKKNDIPFIYCVLESLTNDNKLELCLKSNNTFVHFESIRQIVQTRTAKLSSGQIIKMTECIVKVSNSENLWQQFLKYFNTYPCRYPPLQIPLGKALAKISNEKIQHYVDIMHISTSTISRQNIEECINAFLDTTDDKKIYVLPQKIYNKWNDFMESLDNANDIFCTDFINIVIVYISQEYDQHALYEEIQELVDELLSINNKWFYSNNSKISFFYILMSKLYIFSHAWRESSYELNNTDYLYKRAEYLLNNNLFFNYKYSSIENKYLLEIKESLGIAN